MSKVLVSVPEDREQVLKPILERDPNKGAELLRAGFEARLAELQPSRLEHCLPALIHTSTKDRRLQLVNQERE